MKNAKKIISLLCMLLMLFSISVFANIENEEVIDFKVKANITEVALNGEFTLTVYTDSKSGNEDMSSVYYDILYNAENFEYVSSSANGSVGNKTNIVDGVTYDKRFYVESDLDPAESYAWANLGTVTFKAIKAGTYTMALGEAWVGDADYNASSGDGDVITITVTGGSTGSTDIVVDDETFTDVDDSLQTKDETVTSGDVKVNNKTFATMGANGSIKTYFKKNGTGDVLKAGTYGITVTIGETKYKFPGKADVPADKAWAIKLVIPEGKFADNETVGAFGVAEEY